MVLNAVSIITSVLQSLWICPVPKIFITGCSSGFGLETAKFFLNQDWEVIATMRKPQKDLLRLPSAYCAFRAMTDTIPG